MIRLFAPNETDYATLGLGVLTDVISCKVTRELNGVYDAEIRYQINGAHYSDIVEGAILVMKSSPYSTPQPMRIVSVTEDSERNTATIKARQKVAADIGGYVVAPFTASGIGAAVSGLASHVIMPQGETFPLAFSAIGGESTADFKVSVPASLGACMGGSEGSIIDVYGGEWDYDGVNAIWKTQLGSDRGVTIRYGKNLTSLKRDRDWSTVTGVVGYWENDEGARLVQTGIIETSNASSHAVKRVIPVDLTSAFDRQPTLANLEARVREYITENSVGKVSESLDIKFEQLEKYPEYADIKVLEQVDIGDTVHVQHPEIGIDVAMRVIKTVYNEPDDVYDELIIGDKDKSFSNSVYSAESAISRTQNQIISRTGIKYLSDGDSLYKYIKETDGELRIEVSNATSAASIVAKINESGSTVIINADKINLNGYVTADDLSAVSAEISNLMSGHTEADNIISRSISAGTLRVKNGDAYLIASWKNQIVVTGISITMPSLTLSATSNFNRSIGDTVRGQIVHGYTAGSVNGPYTTTIYYLGRTSWNDA